jgi:hypothetical protein
MKLMKPHFRLTLAINTFGRDTLLRPNDAFDRISATGLNGSLQIIQKAYESFHFMDKAFPAELASRGFYEVTDEKTDNAPGFYYRDDGFKIWNAINNYVADVIENQYLNKTIKDDIVANDPVLQNLYFELTNDGLASSKGIPRFDSVKNLKNFLTTLIWTCTGKRNFV